MRKTSQTYMLDKGGYITWMGYKGSDKAPGIVFCNGYGSDMEGAKCQHLLEWGQKNHRSVTLFDYQGCGNSSGKLEEGTIGLWADNTRKILDHIASPPHILVGSSMGGWIVMLMIRDLPKQLKAAILIAPAPDFPEKLILPQLDARQKQELESQGSITEDNGLILTQKLVLESKKHQLLDGPPLVFKGKLRVLHGMKDDIVPWRYGMNCFEKIQSPDAHMTLVKDGDHRLSRPIDLELLSTTVDAVSKENSYG